MAVDSASSASLAPGFRFHPTDEELVRYYLRRKVCGKPFRFDAISDVDVYKVEPWDLPGLSRLKTRDLEWYFFSCLDKKYGNGSRTNRATEKGYWKTTGKDRPVLHKSQTVGMKKTLVYHCGRAPRGERTNWVMHEYRLIDQELEKARIVQDAFVLCRIFRKSGSGPKNGEQYGAPFIEEEWEDDDLVVVPKEESAGEVTIDDYDAGLYANDIAQILNTDFPAEGAPLPPNYYHEDNNGNFGEVNTHMTSDPNQQFLVGAGENEHWDNQNDEPKLFDLPSHEGMFAKPVKHEYIGEPSNDMNSLEYLLDEQYLDASSDLLLDDGLFLGADGLGFFEANDLNEAIESDPGRAMVDEYINDYPTTDNLQYTFDSSVRSESLVHGSSSVGHEYAHEEAQQETAASQELLEGQAKNDASSSEQDPEFGKGTLYPSFFEKATNMLGKFSAPPAYASEFPTKDAALHLASASSSSVHVTALHLASASSSGAGVDWSLGKHGHVNIVLSFGLAQTDLIGNTGKVDSTMSRSWFYSILLCILVLSMSCKIGTYICPRSFMS